MVYTVPPKRIPPRRGAQQPPLRPWNIDKDCVLCFMPEVNTKWVDYSTQGNHGTIYSATLVNNGRLGQALEFDGVDDYVNCGNDESLNISKNLTIVAWVKPNETALQGIATKITGTTDKQYAFSLGDTGELRFDYEFDGNDYSLTGGNYIIDEWQQVAVIVNSSLDIKLYINASQVVSDTAPAETSHTAEPVMIGKWLGTYDSMHFNGVIDEVQIYNRALSDQEIKNLYEQGKR